MKRLIAIFLCLCAIVSLAACKQEPTSATADPTTEQATDEFPTAPAGTVEQQLMISVAMPAVTNYEKADDGTHIATVTWQDIAMTIPEPEIEEKVVLDFLNRSDIQDEAVSFVANAKQAYATDPEHMTPHILQLTYDPVRLDPGILSLFGTYAKYTGGAHSELTPVSVTYDLISGKVLSLYNILAEDVSGESLEKLVIDVLKEQSETLALYGGFELTVGEKFKDTFRNNASWYFSGDGLCFFFEPYEIAPYSSGTVVAEIPYSKLVGILNDAYFPAERHFATGTVTAERFTGELSDQFTQFSEVEIVKDGEKSLLYTQTSVYDVRIESITWSADGQSFTPVKTVFAAYSLTPGDAVMLEADLGEVLPNLRLKYRSNDKTVSRFITSSGKDGSILLAEN